MSKDALRLSLVIPVFNEAHHILACLKAVESQTCMPFEVIVVDNNCTDNTVELAQAFSFVRIITENRQGRGWARSAGFDAARGEIIGRIDADSVIAIDWVQRVLFHFTNHPDVYGITGLAKTAIVPRIKSFKSTLFPRAYFWFVHASFRTITMWGANMAVRRSGWLQVRTEVCNDDAIVHEDQDISMEFAALGLKLVQDNVLLICTEGQSYNYLPKMVHYLMLERSTLKRHRDKGTYSSNVFRRLGIVSVLPGVLYTVFPGIFLGVTSVVLWPLDRLMIALGKKKTWLD